MQKKVYLGLPCDNYHPYLDRWFKAYNKLSYPTDLVISTTNLEFKKQLLAKRKDLKVIDAEYWNPFKNRVFLITSNREALRKDFLVKSDCEYFLFIDSDIDFPSDTLERLFKLMDKKDLIWSRKVGIIWLAQRELLKAVSFNTGIIINSKPIVYLEEFWLINKEIEFFNRWRPGTFETDSFECKWATHKNNPLGIY